MLDSVFKERVQALVHIALQKCRNLVRDEFSRKSADAAARGQLHPNSTVALCLGVCQEQIVKRVGAVWEAMQRVLDSQGVQYSDDLAQELKALLDYYVPVSLWELPRFYQDTTGKPLSGGDLVRLQEVRAAELRQARTGIDLHVDALRTRNQPVASSATKELEQKFKILFSMAQATRDFAEWKEGLNPEETAIAVLFIDIDHFKPFNERYGHTKVDETLLPESMRLLKRLVSHRGAAYRHGGEEFVVMLPNVDTAEAMAFGEKIRERFEKYRFKIGEKEECITLSIGVALWPAYGNDFAEVLEKANQAELAAKRVRNAVKLATIGSATRLPLPTSGLSENAQRLAALLNEKSENGLEHDPIIDAQALVETLGISEDELAEAADELQDREWVKLQKTLGMGRAGFAALWPTSLLFIETDQELKGWSPREDAKALAGIICETEGGMQLRVVDQRLSWGTRRLNPAAYYLALNEYVQASQTMGSDPYAFHYLRATTKTRRFARD